MINHNTLIDDLKGGKVLSMAMVGGGAGSFFGPVHRAAMRLSGRWRVVAGVFLRSGRNRSQAARLWGSQGTVSMERPKTWSTREKNRVDGIDAALVVTPNASHFEACRVLLEGRVATVCDKPLAASFEEADVLCGLGVQGWRTVRRHLYLCRLPNDP